LTPLGFVVFLYHERQIMFGEFIKKIRSEKRLGLREFCIASDCDPSNWSKIERGTLPPPQDQGFLNRIAVILGLSEDSKERELIFDYAAIDAGKIPQYVLQDAELVKRLPVFFRTATGKKPTTEDLEKLAEILKNS
jgi:transcriptional regulator with XRE-family HTH domain